MSSRDVFIRDTLEQAVRGTLTIQEATDRLLQEMGRGGRTLVLDENVADLYIELDKLNYTVKDVPLHLTDEEIKKSGILKGRVLVTENGKDFDAPKDMQAYYYGLIWVKSKGVAHDRAKKIETALMTSNFSANLVQVVIV